MTASLVDPAELARRLAPIERWLVVLDFDGTLSPIVDRPDAARPADGAIDAVQAAASRTEVAIVSGRGLEDLSARLGTELAIILAGGHGTEVRTPDGRRTLMIDSNDVAPVLDTANDHVNELVATSDGWLVERKDASLAVHYRNVPQTVARELLPRVRAALESRCDEPPGFELISGKAVLELRPVGVDKGTAVAWLIERSPALKPLVIGDDVTDEDAFREAAARDGATVLVAEEPRDTAAAWRVTGPEEVVALLDALTEKAV